MSKILTLQQVIAMKAIEDAEFNAKLDAIDREQARIARILLANPQIGILQRGDAKIYYVYKDGYLAKPVVALDPAELV